MAGMTGVNKRPYQSRLRAQRAEQTRARILDAARDLFLANGYVRATTAAIATHAGVSEAMLFAAFGTKAGVLEALIGRAVVDDQAPVALRDRPVWAGLAAEYDDPRAAVRRFAETIAAIQQRTWRLIELTRAASDADEAMARLLAQGAANRRADCRDFVEHAIAAALRPDLTPAEAADVLWLYSSADVYRLLVGTAAWTHERYAAWLADTLARALLEDPAS